MNRTQVNMMKALKLIFCLFIFNHSYAQYTFPHISLPNHKERWRTYLDAQSVQYSIRASASDNKNNVLILGQVYGNPNNFHLVTPGAFQPAIVPGIYNLNICLVKFDSSGKRLWGTYFGQSIAPYGIDCDAAGNIYVCGGTPGITPLQNWLPVTPNAHQTQQVPGPGGLYGGEGFLAKFSPTGSLLWSTYYGGEGADVMTDLKVDKKANIYCTGYTTSGSGISTPGGFKEVFLPGLNPAGQSTNGMLVKFDSSGRRQWGTYYGGDNTTRTDGNYLSIDSSDNIIIAGTTSSHIGISTPGTHLQDFATAGINQTRIFLAKFNPAGNRLWGTYYGSAGPISNSDLIILCGVKAIGENIYFDGFTNITTEIATAGSFMGQLAGMRDAYIVKLNKDGTRNWGSYYGSSGVDIAKRRGLEVAKDNKALYLLGGTNSTSGISTTNVYNPEEINGNSFLMKIDLEGNRIWGAYLSAYHNLQVFAGDPNGEGNLLLCTKEGALYTGIIQPTQGSQPIGDTTVFQNIAGAGTNLLTKYSDTTTIPIINTPPVILAVPLSFEVYPNPSNGQFTIRTTSTQPYDYIIYAADGKRIKSNITTGYYTPVNITATAAGIYIVKATDRSTGQVYHRKIVKR